MILNSCRHGFDEGVRRATELCNLGLYISNNNPSILDITDLHRSAVVLVISAFDYLIHEVVRVSILYRCKNSIELNKIHIPIGIAFMVGDEKLNAIDEHVRRINSFQSFVSPDKFSEALKVLLPNPWIQISTHLRTPETDLKRQLKEIYNWRNRIAHEMDIDPTFGGIHVWPIYYDDVVNSIEFIRILEPARKGIERYQ